KDDAVGTAALARGKPAFYKLRGGRIHDRLTHSEDEAEGQENRQRSRGLVRDARDKKDEDSPPRAQQRQRKTRPHAAREEAGGNLECRIADEERAEDVAEDDLVDAELALDRDAGDGEIGAVHIRQRAENKNAEHEQIPYRQATAPAIRLARHHRAFTAALHSVPSICDLPCYFVQRRSGSSLARLVLRQRECKDVCAGCDGY